MLKLKTRRWVRHEAKVQKGEKLADDRSRTSPLVLLAPFSPSTVPSSHFTAEELLFPPPPTIKMSIMFRYHCAGTCEQRYLSLPHSTVPYRHGLYAGKCRYRYNSAEFKLQCRDAQCTHWLPRYITLPASTDLGTSASAPNTNVDSLNFPTAPLTRPWNPPEACMLRRLRFRRPCDVLRFQRPGTGIHLVSAASLLHITTVQSL